MTQSNQIQKNDDFMLLIVFRIEVSNCRALMVKMAGIVATLIAFGVKIAVIFIGRTHWSRSPKWMK
jgi:hypothetical protein